MSKPKLLDAFCGAGGCTRGYQMAGFDVTGVDIKPQSRYVGERFVQGDAIAFIREHGHEFDAIHASPPCQAHSAMRTMPDARAHDDLIPATRDALRAIGVPYVIENVVGAPLINPITLCGSMFGLAADGAELRRHRLFESNMLLLSPQCRHGWIASDVIGIYGGHVRNRRRVIGVYGKGVRDSLHKFDRGVDEFTVEQGREAMGVDWMTLAELCQSIPPAYTHHLGLQLIAALSFDVEAA